MRRGSGRTTEFLVASLPGIYLARKPRNSRESRGFRNCNFCYTNGNMTRLPAHFLLFVALSAIAFPASSGAATWYLSGVGFTDGTTASGSFVYNAGVYSSINITTTAGAHYVAQHPSFSSNAGVLRLVTLASGDLTSTPYLVLNFAGSLPDGGGTVQLSTSNPYDEFTCSNAGCTTATQLRKFSAGAVTTTTTTSATGVPALTDTGLALAAVLLAACGVVLMRKHAAHSA